MHKTTYYPGIQKPQPIVLKNSLDIICMICELIGQSQGNNERVAQKSQWSCNQLIKTRRSPS